MSRRALLQVLHSFERIPLEEVPPERQMERFDRKYVLHSAGLAEVLQGLQSEFRTIEAGGEVLCSYHNQYLDTEDLLFYRQHSRGQLARWKLRYRSYLSTGSHFLEIKKKSNRGRTVKSRVEVPEVQHHIPTSLRTWLQEQGIGLPAESLKPSVRVGYKRISFISDSDRERFSIDVDICGSLYGRAVNLGEVAVIEIKQDHPFTSTIIARLRAASIREASLSKYCVTAALAADSLRSNAFKPILRTISKINSR